MPPLVAVSNGQLSDQSMWNQYRDLFRGGHVHDVVAGYGADPTGAADSTSKIQDAIDAAAAFSEGGIVFFPVGTYKITSTLTVTTAFQGLALVGAARGSFDASTGSSIQIGASFTGTAMVKVQQSGTPTQPLQGITIENLLFNGNNVGTTVDGIYFQAYNSLIYNVEVANCTGNGIHVQGLASPLFNTYNTKISHCWTHHNALSGVYIDTNGDDTQEIAVHSFFNGLDGSRINSATDHMIIGCHNYSNTGHGINFIGAASGSIVTTTLCEVNSKAGIYFDDTAAGAYNCIIKGCYIFSNGAATVNTWDNIMVAPANAHGTNVIIANCQLASWVSGRTRYGVSLTGQAQGCIVQGNVFMGTYGTARILASGDVSSSLYCKVADNSGVNPVGSLTPPGIPASGGAAVANPFNYDCTVYIAKAATTGPGPVTIGGTSTGVTLGSTIPVAMFRVPAGSTIGLGTYTGTAPTWTWFGD